MPDGHSPRSVVFPGNFDVFLRSAASLIRCGSATLSDRAADAHLLLRASNPDADPDELLEHAKRMLVREIEGADRAECGVPEAGDAEPARISEEETRTEIERLSRLSKIAYQRERMGAAKALRLRAVSLDKMVAQEKRRRQDEAERKRAKEPPPEAGEARWPTGFAMSEEGLFLQSDDEAPPVWICAPFEVLGEARNTRGEGWGKWLRWLDRDGREHKLPVADRLLHLANGELEATLADRGLRINPEARLRGALRKALAGVWSGSRVSLVQAGGWKTLRDGIIYVFADGSVIGESDERIVLHPAPENGERLCGTAGTLDGWKTEVARFAEGNAPAAFAICLAFAGATLDVFGEVSGGFHFVGVSKTGKTLAARCGLSVWGLPSEKGALRSWHNTVNALENVAEESSDGLLVLDEIHQADATKVVKAIYLIANEAGKGRMRDDSSPRARRSWRTLLLSTGECDIAAMAAKAGQRVPAGAEVRLPSIRTTAENTWTALHGYAGLEILAPVLLDAMRCQHGTAGRAFIERMVQERLTDPDGLATSIASMRQRFLAPLPAGADPQVKDVARRFALVACAGELAASWSLLPWKEGEPERAAATMFRRWLESRGGVGASEIDQRIQAIRRLLIADGAARFVVQAKDNLSGKWQDRNPERPFVNRLGILRIQADGSEEYYIPASMWPQECNRLEIDPVETAKTLLACGALVPGEGKNLAKKARIPGFTDGRFYIIRASALAGDDGQDEQECE